MSGPPPMDRDALLIRGPGDTARPVYRNDMEGLAGAGNSTKGSRMKVMGTQRHHGDIITWHGVPDVRVNSIDSPLSIWPARSTPRSGSLARAVPPHHHTTRVSSVCNPPEACKFTLHCCCPSCRCVFVSLWLRDATRLPRKTIRQPCALASDRPPRSDGTYTTPAVRRWMSWPGATLTKNVRAAGHQFARTPLGRLPLPLRTLLCSVRLRHSPSPDKTTSCMPQCSFVTSCIGGVDLMYGFCNVALAGTAVLGMGSTYKVSRKGPGVTKYTGHGNITAWAGGDFRDEYVRTREVSTGGGKGEEGSWRAHVRLPTVPSSAHTKGLFGHGHVVCPVMHGAYTAPLQMTVVSVYDDFAGSSAAAHHRSIRSHVL